MASPEPLDVPVVHLGNKPLEVVLCGQEVMPRHGLLKRNLSAAVENENSSLPHFKFQRRVKVEDTRPTSSAKSFVTEGNRHNGERNNSEYREKFRIFGKNDVHMQSPPLFVMGESALVKRGLMRRHFRNNPLLSKHGLLDSLFSLFVVPEIIMQPHGSRIRQPVFNDGRVNNSVFNFDSRVFDKAGLTAPLKHILPLFRRDPINPKWGKLISFVNNILCDFTRAKGPIWVK